MIDGPGRVSTAPMGAYVALQAGVKPHTLRHQALTATATATPTTTKAPISSRPRSGNYADLCICHT